MLLLQRPVPVLVADARPQRQPRQVRLFLPRFLRGRRRSAHAARRQPVKRDPRQGFPFSMKDLALPDHLPALRAAGVSCFKIEGRKKSPLYVATTTDYYRKLLDGTLAARRTAAAWKPTCRPSSAGRGRGCSCNRTRTRKWPTATRSAIAARRIGQVEAVRPAATRARLRFRTRRRPGTPRRPADRPARAGQAVRLRGRASCWLLDGRQGKRTRGVRGPGRRPGRGRPAGRSPASCRSERRSIARRRRRSSRATATRGQTGIVSRSARDRGRGGGERKRAGGGWAVVWTAHPNPPPQGGRESPPPCGGGW